MYRCACACAAPTGCGKLPAGVDTGGRLMLKQRLLGT